MGTTTDNYQRKKKLSKSQMKRTQRTFSALKPRTLILIPAGLTMKATSALRVSFMSVSDAAGLQ